MVLTGYRADVLDPAYAATPAFLAACSYQNPTDLHDTPFNTPWATKLPLWDWLSEHPEHRAHFNRFMYAQRSSVKDCFSTLNLEEDVLGWPAEKPLFVDVGGGTGQQCIALREKWPMLKGKVVLQDLPSVVDNVHLAEAIEVMAYDFFTEQPIKGMEHYDSVRCCAHGIQAPSSTTSELLCTTTRIRSVWTS
jgi:demethylsterigmatocystin 6-O-methyltransferase